MSPALRSTVRSGHRSTSRARPRLATLAGAAAGACAARAAFALLRRYPPGGEKTWVRTNHRGEPVTLLEGPALALGAVTGEAIAAAAGRHRFGPAVLAGLGAAGFGVLDDLRGSGKRRGLRGHLGALAHGEVTTGTVKLAGLAATGLGAALLSAVGPGGAGDGGAGNDRGHPADLAVSAGLIAGGANLLNLFDLRPGRAVKFAGLSASAIALGGALRRESATAPGPGSAGRLAGLAAVAAPAGAALALLPEDLGERAMLGDAGANALGALLGAAAARSLPRRARAGLLVGIIALTVASEKVSFTRVIAATPPLHWLDMLGRRPVLLAAPAVGPAEDGGPGEVSAPAGPAGAGMARRTPWHRTPGRHRRVATRVSRFRSAAWFSSWLKMPAPTDQ